MNRSDIERDYKILNGRIDQPGKFEGEPVYIPFFWALGMVGGASRDDGTWFEFDIDSGDMAMWGEELRGIRILRLRERDDGFVVHQKVP